MASSSSKGGSNTTREWWWLGYDQRLPVRVDQWQAYEPAVQYHLSASFAALQIEERSEGSDDLILDLAPFTDPPSPYQVWRGQPLKVTNTNETELCGKLAIAGYTKELWDLPPGQLPPSAKHGRIVAGFYQIRREHTELMKRVNAYLADPDSPPWPFEHPPRRRVVVLIEVEQPSFMCGADRFRKRKAPPAAPVEAVENDSVPPGEAVFQWWWGEPQEGGFGHWKSYHPHVSARLEKALLENEQFRSGLEPVPIDEVRYCLQRITPDRPFDYVDQSSREPFLDADRITTEHGLFDAQTRATKNCFVQFQRGNPKRRRPVRRIRRGEAAGLEMPDGEPCSVCFSDVGVLTGCDKGHVICGSCLRMALRITVGDVTQTENLVCGCLQIRDHVAFEHLTARADDTLQVLLHSPPTDEQQRREFDTELAEVQKCFGLADQVPANIYRERFEDWIDKVHKRAAEHLYHACCHPGCGMENWILREDFDKNHRAMGECNWLCAKGHWNSVLPTQEEIDAMNKNILLHPEYYTDTCAYDNLNLRRFRLCPDCVTEGLLTFAVHEAGCKQWPGGSSGHRHCFCFHCTKKWGQQPGECHHQSRCQDPGIQQVRRMPDGRGSEKLEIGFICGDAYIAWVNGTSTSCPPTEFPSGQSILGLTRQAQLEMEDTAKLRKIMAEGTQ